MWGRTATGNEPQKRDGAEGCGFWDFEVEMRSISVETRCIASVRARARAIPKKKPLPVPEGVLRIRGF